MKTKIHQLFWAASLIILCTQCQSPETGKHFIKYIPDLKDGKSRKLEGARATRDSLGFDNLENGYDSLQIRIAFMYRNTDTFQVLNIKRNNGIWNGYFCITTYLLNKTDDTVARYAPIAFTPLRRNDWGVIVDSLISFHIMTLPDQREVISIDEFPIDGANAVQFEVADAHQYRIYAYEWPSSFKDKHKEAEDVYKIIYFLSARLGIHYLGSF